MPNERINYRVPSENTPKRDYPLSPSPGQRLPTPPPKPAPNSPQKDKK